MVHLDQGVADRWVAASLARFKADDPATVVCLVMLRAVLALRRGDHAAAVALARDAVRASRGYYGSRSVLAELATHAGTPDAEALVDAAVQESPGGRGWWSAYTPRTLWAYLGCAPTSPIARVRCSIDSARYQSQGHRRRRAQR